MERFLQIVQVLPFQEREYTDRNGQQQMFASRGFVLTDGIDYMYAEMQGEYARSMKDTQFDTSSMHRVQMQMATRMYHDKDGAVRYSNDIRIVKMA